MRCCTTALIGAYEDEYELIRIPPDIYPALQCSLNKHRSFVVSWILAVRRTYPKKSLLELLRSRLDLFPSGLHTGIGDACIQVHQYTPSPC